MVINHNLNAMYAQRQNKNNGLNVANNIEKLASGMQINKAADDAAGLAISEKMRAQVRGLNQAERNANDGISLIQTTEGWLEETTQLLQRLRELSVKAANGTYAAEDRLQIQVEVSQIIDEVNRVASHAQFNGMNLLTGSFSAEGDAVASMWIHVGANIDQREKLHIGTMTAEALGLQSSNGPANTGSNFLVNLQTQDGANSAIAVLDEALKRVSKQRADLGAYQNRLEMATKGIAIGSENLQAAESRIRDTDMAKEMVEFTKNNILTQASQSMLSQANQMPQQVLQLLQ